MHFSQQQEYKKACKILGISENSDQEQIRAAYLKLVKKYHPDSGSKDSSAEKFHEVDEAFKYLLKRKSEARWEKVEERWQKVENEPNEAKEQDIKHTAPQHRQFLEYEGMSGETPFQRQKYHLKKKAMKASQNVLKHRLEKLISEENAIMKKTSVKHDIKTKYGFDRLVEDLIQESMSKGEFDKLSGVGKPLAEKSNRNPYVDLVTHKLNEVLIDNGFTPEWIMLQKEIRLDLENLKTFLETNRSCLKPLPLDEEEENFWKSCVDSQKSIVKQINEKIDKFNLIVPILNKQMFQINLISESDAILKNGLTSKQTGLKRKAIKEKRSHENLESALDISNIFTLFQNIFIKK